MLNWTIIQTEITQLPHQEAIQIFEDGKAMGFAIKIDNGKFYAREELNNTRSLITNFANPVDKIRH